MNSVREKNDRAAGFTIVELLTVMSVIVILIGLLVPSLNKVKRFARDVKQKAQEVARQEAEALLNRARAEIQHERDEAISVVRREFADLTILAAGKVIERSLDKKEHRELIDQVLEESSEQKKD